MSERFGRSDKDWAEISDPATICNRLRGQYNIPVNDGAGPLNGSMVFSRSFQTTPIQNAAADLIDQLQATVAEQAQKIERMRALVEDAYEEGFRDSKDSSTVLYSWENSLALQHLQPKEDK